MFPPTPLGLEGQGAVLEMWHHQQVAERERTRMMETWCLSKGGMQRVYQWLAGFSFMQHPTINLSSANSTQRLVGIV
jgi:hypothetical protein